MAYSWEKEQARLNQLMIDCLEESDNEFDVQFDDQEEFGEEDHVEEQDLHTDTEQEISDVEEPENLETPWEGQPMFVGKDGVTHWAKHVPKQNVKTRAQNLIKHLPGVKGTARGLKREIDIWKYFFTDDILNSIVYYTNKHIQLVRPNYQRERDARDTDIVEIRALIGLLYLAGVLKSSRLHTEELWAKNATGVELFRLTMSEKRFLFLLVNLRFDDLETRNDRTQFDKLAPIREVFDAVVNNYKTAYTPFEFVTIDEKLEGFRGRCSFRQYIPSKPNKYGIKIFAMADSKTFYTLNMEVYVGKQPDGPYECSNSPTAVVQRLCQPIKGTSRNVTVDNWFTSMDLLTSLYTDFKLTLLGTVRKNKKQLPLEFSRPSGRPIASSMFAFRNDCTLVSYIPKKNKNVLLLSSMHFDDKIDASTNKPDMIMDYNASKGGVDCVDKLCAAYDCARNTKRWPMVLFYSLLNVTGINSFVIFSINNATEIRRRMFLRALSSQLVEEHVRRRATQPIPRAIQLRINEVFGAETTRAHPVPETPAGQRGRCFICDRRKNRPTRYSCVECHKFICLEHSLMICPQCHP